MAAGWLATGAAEGCAWTGRVTTAAPTTSRRSARDFPILAQQRLRQAAGLSRQRRLGAEAAGGDRRAWCTPTSTNTPTCIAACTTSPMPRPRPTRRRARRVRALPQRAPRPTRSSSPARRPRRSTSSPPRFGRMRDRRGRRDRALDHGAPLQHRALAFPARAQGRGAQVGAGRRRRRLPRLEAFEKLLDAAHQDRRDHAHVERARHGDADEGDRRASPMRAAFRCWSTAARARCTSTSTCATSTPTSTSSPATRSTGRPASACSTASGNGSSSMPPFNGGGEMIGEVTLDTRHL